MADATEKLFEEVDKDEPDSEVMKQLIDDGADVNKPNEQGETPLHLAAKFGNKEIIQLLIDKGANPNAQDNDNRTPLYKAKNSDIVRFLIKNGADSSITDNSGLGVSVVSDIQQADEPFDFEINTTVEQKPLKDQFQEAAAKAPEEAAPSVSYEEEARYEPDEIPALIDEAMKTGDTQKLEKLKNDLVEMKETDPAYVAAADQAISKHLGKLYGDHADLGTEQDTSSNFYTLCKLDAVASYFEKANPGLLKKEGKIAHDISVNNKRTDDNKYNLATYDGDDLDGELAERFAEAHAKEEAAHEKELKSAAPEAKSEVTHNVANNTTYQPATNNVQAGMR